MPDTDTLSLTLPKTKTRVKRKRRKLKPPSRIHLAFLILSMIFAVNDWLLHAWISLVAMVTIAVVSWFRVLRSMGEHPGPVVDRDPRLSLLWAGFLFAMIATAYITGK
jgi:hypothetical protein